VAFTRAVRPDATDAAGVLAEGAQAYETDAPATEMSFTFDRLATVLLFLAIALGALLMPAQNDTWWQLRAGQEMWATHHVLLRDTFSHTTSGAFWPNHEWLFQALLYGVYAVGGIRLVTIVAAAAVTGAWLLAWNMTAGTTRSRFLLTALALVPSSTIWGPRPQVLSLFLLAVTMWLLRVGRYGWLPVVFLLWANLHGAVMMGVLVLAAALVASLIENRRASRDLALACAACLLVTLATPLGWTFWTEIPKSLSRIRQLGIDEWAPPSLTSQLLMPFWAIASALVVVAVARRRTGSLATCASALAVLPLALTAERNVPPFLLLAVPAIAALTASRSEAAGAPARRIDRTPLNVAIAAVAGALVMATVAYAYATPIDHMRWAPLPPDSLTALRSCPGNLYNRYDEGGYLIWFARDHKVFLDGRQDPYPVALIEEQVRVENTGDYADLFRRYDIHCAYVPAASNVSAHLQRAGWVSLFRDARWILLAG